MADSDPVNIAPSCDTPLHTWFRQNDLPADFASRLASQRSLPADDAKSDWDPLMSLHHRSIHTSTVVHVHSEYDLDSLAADSLPALTRGNSIASNLSATSTDRASVIDGGFVMESEDGILTRPARLQPHGDLLCPFQILNCHRTCVDVVEFKTHVFSHFRGHPLPLYAQCFICGDLFFQRSEDDNALAWNNMLTHMVYDHYRSGLETCVIRADAALMRYMWNKGIISDAEFSSVQLEAPETRLPGANDEQNRPLVPEVPMAPPAPVPAEIRDHLSQSAGPHAQYDDDARGQPVGPQSEQYFMVAGRRQDRRQRDRTFLRSRITRGSNL